VTCILGRGGALVGIAAAAVNDDSAVNSSEITPTLTLPGLLQEFLDNLPDVHGFRVKVAAFRKWKSAAPPRPSAIQAQVERTRRTQRSGGPYRSSASAQGAATWSALRSLRYLAGPCV